MIDNETFITTWQSATSLEDVAKKFHTTVEKIQNKYWYMRSHGVTLKSFPRRCVPKPAVDWAKLDALAKKLAP